MRIALGQINCTVGDLSGNVDLMLDASRKAADRGAELIAFPELSFTGYPPRDLVEKPSFSSAPDEALERLAAGDARASISSSLCGYVGARRAASGRPATNSARAHRRRAHRVPADKMLLPTYDVFDEARYFLPGGAAGDLSIPRHAGRPDDLRRRLERQAVLGAPAVSTRPGGGTGARRAPNCLISINASPYHMGKRALRRDIFAAVAPPHGMPAGLREPGRRQRSAGVRRLELRHGRATGEVIASAASFARTWCWSTPTAGPATCTRTSRTRREAVYEALVLGHPRLHPQVRLPARADRPERRHRFVADGVHRSGRRGPRERRRRRHAGTVLLRSQRARRPRAWPQNLGIRFEIVSI